MQVTKEFNLNVNQSNDYPCVFAKQADDQGRVLKIWMYNDRQVLTIPSTATISFRALKPDGNQIYTTGSVSSDGAILVTLDEQILAVAGLVKADVSVTHNAQILSTGNFVIRVAEIPLGNDIPSTSEFIQLSELIIQATGAIDDCEQAVDDCEQAISDAQDAVEEAIQNIDSAVVRTTAQAMTETQKAQARTNINALEADGSMLRIDDNGLFYFEEEDE